MLLKVLPVVMASLLASMAAAQSGETMIYEGGHVWTGSRFEPSALAVRDGRIVSPQAAGEPSQRIVISSGFIVPAYGNAHAHITNATPANSRFYTDAGVFYVWNPNTIVLDAADKAFFARPDTYDVKTAQGGITEPGGHPERLYVEFLSQSVYRGKPRNWFVGNAFNYGATPAEIDRSLDLLVRQGADFVKAYLLDSARYRALRDDPKAYGRRGLDPVNLPYLVARAHARGMPVAVHVETAHDLKVAAWANADLAAHLPGYGASGPGELAGKRIDAETAALVARAGMKLVPTYGLIRGSAYSEGQSRPKPEAAAAIELQIDNLERLRAAGATLLIGTDGSGAIWSEVEHLVEIGALSAAEATERLLATGAALFPERRVGCLQPGCEADFLVLAGDPTRDIKALRRIEQRVMAGKLLPGPGPAGSSGSGEETR